MIDSLTAERYINSFPTASPEEQDRMRTELSEFRDAAKSRIQGVQDEHFDKAYRDDGYYDSFAKQPEIAAATGPLDDQATVAADSLNRAFLSHVVGVPVDLVSANYESIKDAYTQTYFNRTGVGATELRGLIRGQYEQRDVARKQIARLPAQLALAKFEDFESGRNRTGTEILNEIRSKNPQAFRPEWELPMLQMISSIEQETDARMRGLTPEAHRVFNILAKQTGVKERPDSPVLPGASANTDEIAQLLLKSPDKADDILEMVGLVASETADPKKFFHQLGESIGRSLSDIAGSTNLMAQEIYYERLKLMASGPLSPLRVIESAEGKLIPITQVPSQYNPGSVEGRLATEEDRVRLRANADQALAAIAVRRKIDRFAKDFDPIKPNATGFLGMLEQGAYNTASSAPLLAATAIPYLGVPIAASASTALTYDDIRAREKDTSVGLAFARASLTGLLQTSLDKVQLGQLAGRNPVTGGLIRELVRPDGPLIQRIALKAAGNYAEQTGVEITQNSVPLMVDLLAKTLGADMPDFNADERLAELKAATPQTFVDTLFPWFVGTGVISVKEMKNGERFRRNAAGFEDIGIPKAEARDLASTENAEEFDRKFRQAFDKLTPEQRSDYIARKNAQTQGGMPTAERNGNEWIIRSHNGREIYRSTNEEAAQAAFNLEAARSRESTALKMSKSAEVTPADIGHYWLKIAEDPKTATYTAIPKATNLGAVMEELTGGARQLVDIESIPTRDPDLPGIVKFTEKNNGGYILLKPVSAKEFYIFSAQAGNLGTPIYQTAFSWAHNNGYRIVGDPHGFLDLGATRQTTHMFNSALRFRTTRHMQPHPEQEIEGWRDDDTAEAVAHNIGLLAIRESDLVRKNLNWLDDLAYREGSFYHGNIPISAENRDSYIGARIAELDSNFTQGAGPRTVARALVTAAAQRSGNRLGGVLGTVPDSKALEGVLYSQAEGTTALSESTRPPVESWIDSATKNWRKDISVKIHDSADLIPDENLRQTVLNEGGTVEGFYNPTDGSIHILADRMHSQADVQRVLRHEGMHWAFANALQKEYRDLLAGTRAKIPDDKLKELLAKYRNASDATIVEEYLAYEGQNNPKSTVWRTFAYEAKRLLRKVFGDSVQFTDKDIVAFLTKANRRLKNQEKSSGTIFQSRSFGAKRPYHIVSAELRGVEPAFQKLGIEIAQSPEADSAQIRALPDGTLRFEYNPKQLIADESRAQKFGVTANELTQMTFSEEIIHAAHMTLLRDEWKLSSRRLTFDKFVELKNEQIFHDLKKAISIPTLTKNERSVLRETVASIYHSYFSDYEQPLNIQSEKIFETIAASNDTVPFIAEFLRQAIQLRREGKIREEPFSRAFKKIEKWVREVLNRIRDSLPEAFSGAFGPRVQSTLASIEKLLDEIDE